MHPGRVGIQVISNRPEYMAVLLSSLLRQNFQKWDLIIVFNKCKMEESPIVTTLLERILWEGHRVKFMKVPDNLGIGELRNMALESDDDEYGIRIDDDSWCEPTYLQRLYNVITDPDIKPVVGVVGGIVPYMAAEKIYRFKTGNFNEVTDFMDTIDDTIFFYPYDCWYPCDHLRSSYMYINQKARDIGGFPTDYDKLAGFREETDFCLRMKFAGNMNFFVPKAVCWHLASPTRGTRDAWNVIGEEGKVSAEKIFKEKMFKLRDNHEVSSSG